MMEERKVRSAFVNHELISVRCVYINRDGATATILVIEQEREWIDRSIIDQK
jgi:hypothetical protein